MGRSARIGEKESFRIDFDNYYYVGFEIDPVASEKEQTVNWTARAGVVYKWLHVGASHQTLQNLNDFDYRDYTIHVSKVFYITKEFLILTGVKSGYITRRQTGRFYYGFEIETSYRIGSHFAFVIRASYDRRTDWAIFGWTVGFRESGWTGVRFIF